MRDEYEKLLLTTQTPRARQDVDAYLAGFFDGEGHINVKRNPRRPNSCYVDIGATQVDRGPLRLLVRAYGGSIHKKSKGKNNVKVCYAWKCGSSREVFWALSRMLPWLIVKRKKARVALIVLRNRPLNCVGGQISKYQMTAINKALKGIHVTRTKA